MYVCIYFFIFMSGLLLGLTELINHVRVCVILLYHVCRRKAQSKICGSSPLSVQDLTGCGFRGGGLGRFTANLVLILHLASYQHLCFLS